VARPGARRATATALETRFKPPAHLAVRVSASHMTVSQAGPTRKEHDAVAIVLIIGASRGTGLETVRAALEAEPRRGVDRALTGQFRSRVSLEAESWFFAISSTC
jgi:hypothetical protein